MDRKPNLIKTFLHLHYYKNGHFKIQGEGAIGAPVGKVWRLVGTNFTEGSKTSFSIICMKVKMLDQKKIKSFTKRTSFVVKTIHR